MTAPLNYVLITPGISPPCRRGRLDGGYDRPNERLANRVIPGKVVLPSPTSGHRGAQCPRLFVLLC